MWFTSRMGQPDMNARLLLLMGPTGAGKSTLVRALEARDHRFQYIATRELRPGELDRVSVSETELQRLWQSGELLAVNELYSTKYGTPRAPILHAFDQGKFPIIEWPISRLSVMEEAFPRSLFRVYVRPPSVRHIAERNNYAERLGAAQDELVRLDAHEYDDKIDLLVTSDVSLLIKWFVLTCSNSRGIQAWVVFSGSSPVVQIIVKTCLGSRRV